MTPEQINKFLAEKLMGWKYIGEPQYVYHTGDNLAIYTSYKREASSFIKHWNPYTDIKQAFEVVGKMRKKGFMIYIVCNDIEFACHIFNMIDQMWESYSETPSAAICLAAVEALKDEI